MPTTVYFAALGCPKNRVDTERMAALARRQGLRQVSAPEAAEVIVVNTCGFILPAKEESIDTVLELAQHKTGGRCRCLVVAGCLAQRHPDELAQAMPEVDHFIGTEDLARLQQILASDDVPRVAVSPLGSAAPRDEDYDRELSGPTHVAYLKIAEGCDRRCSFCIIPELRGRQRSRSVDSLVQEAQTLVQAGVRELVLVAQDSTAYGRDLSPTATLVQLLQRLDEVPGLHWLRLLYAYPTAVDATLLAAMAQLPRVVPYIDVPLQHADDQVLRRMRRGYGGAEVRALIESLRREIPGVFIRTTLITGHPGEDEQAYQRLAQFVAEAELDHLGVFPFCAEEGTAAAALPDQVPAQLAQVRADALMALQREISARRLQRLRGQRLQVLVDGPSPESDFLLQGRHAGQAPEVDGTVILTDSVGLLQPGQLAQVRVSDSGDYDLVAAPDGDG